MDKRQTSPSLYGQFKIALSLSTSTTKRFSLRLQALSQLYHQGITSRPDNDIANDDGTYPKSAVV